MSRPLIGVSPRLLHKVPHELGFRGKTLQYLEQSVVHWAMAHHAVTVMIPSMLRGHDNPELPVSVGDFAERLDGLILQGGADIDPGCYGQAQRDSSAFTDPVRDRFELSLLRAFMEAGKPVLGICRGMQLINVLLGGSLHQDLLAAGVTTLPHVNTEIEEEHRHSLRLQPGGWLSRLHGGCTEAMVNSIHHQGIDRLGEGLEVEASSPDGIIEAIRLPSATFLVGVQWHPEFHDHRFPELLSAHPLMDAFLDACRPAP